MTTSKTSYGLIVLALLVGVLAGKFWPDGSGDTDTSAGPDEVEILYWVAPMDPEYRRDGPGKSPMGMDLVPVYARDQGESDPALVTIDPTVVNNLGVRTAPAQRGALARRVETVGYVSYDEDTLQHIHS